MGSILSPAFAALQRAYDDRAEPEQADPDERDPEAGADAAIEMIGRACRALVTDKEAAADLLRAAADLLREIAAEVAQ